MPTEKVPTPITTSQRRATAAAVVTNAAGLSPLTAELLVRCVDVSTAAILGQVGCDESEIRRAAAALWV